MLCPCHINTSLRCLLHHSVSSMSMLAARDVSYVRCHADSSNGTVEQLLTSYSHWTESLLWRQENPVWIYLEFTLSSPVKILWVPPLKHTGVRVLCQTAFWQTISWDGCRWCQHDMAPKHTSNSSVIFHIVVKQWHHFFFPTRIHQHEGTCVKLYHKREWSTVTHRLVSWGKPGGEDQILC